MRVIGLDLSLTSTGVCKANAVQGTMSHIIRTTNRLSRYERLAKIRDSVLDTVGDAGLVVVEELPSHGPNNATIVRLGELHGVIGTALHEWSVPVARVAVSSLKKYATGKGNAKKTDLRMAALKRFGIEFDSDDECDAFFLAMMGLESFGIPVLGLEGKALPQANRDALEKVEWPQLREAR